MSERRSIVVTEKQMLAERFQRTLEYFHLNQDAISHSPHTEMVYPIEIDENRRDYIKLNNAFLSGHGRVLLATYKDLVSPLVKTNNPTLPPESLGWEEVNDPEGFEMAQDILYLVAHSDDL